MSAAKVLLTAEEFDNYPFEEDKRYELDEGEFLVTEKPAYKHNRILLTLTVDVGLYLTQNPIGEALISENVYAISPTTRRSPDLSVILGDHRAELWSATVIPIIPELAAEVLSPNETVRMILRKLRQYFTAGVKEVWLIDPETKTVEVWTGPRLPEQELTEADTLTSALLPGFSLPLKPLFSLQ
jgi:Uma2 family endonuclease